MEAVSRRYAYSTLQLRFTFMRGLHPFFPPRLEVGASCQHTARLHINLHQLDPLPGL